MLNERLYTRLNHVCLTILVSENFVERGKEAGACGGRSKYPKIAAETEG